MREKLLDIGIQNERISVIHNWVDASAIHPVPSEDNPLRKEWDLEGKFVVGYSGNLGRAHEFETILGAAVQRQSHKDIVFLFIGGGAQTHKARLASEAHGLTNILFKPYQPREALSFSLGVSDIHLVVLQPSMEGLIVPSKYYGIVTAGKPVIFIGNENGGGCKASR